MQAGDILYTEWVMLLTKEAQPWFAPTGKNFDFECLICLNMAHFNADIVQI